MPTFKSGAFAQQCYSSHPHSLTFKGLRLITPGIAPAHPGAAKTAPLPIAPARPSSAETELFPPAPARQTELARPGALFNLRDGINQPVEKPSTSDPPTISPPHPESGIPPTLPKPAETGFPSRRTDSLPLGAAETGSIPIYRVVLTCDACDMRHRFVIEALTSRLGQREERDAEAMSQLSHCATAHCLDLRVSGMDVINDSVGLRCGKCHRAYHLSVSAIETYQK